MNDFQYTKWIPDANSHQTKLEELIGMFNYIMIQTNGDVEEAIDWMKFLDNRYRILGDVMNFEEFVKALEEQGLIEKEKTAFALTDKGGRRIREDSLKQIFSSLKKGLAGGHDTPFEGEGVERLRNMFK